MQKLLILLAPLLFLPGCSILKFDTVSLHSGYFNAAIKGEDIQGVPNLVRADWRITELNPEYGRLTVGIEGFHYNLRKDSGSIIGATPMARFTYPIKPWLGAYVEGGAGPIYLGVETFEQEEKGFSFLDQVGAGIELNVNSRWSFLLGYRFSHISHARLKDTRNRGIESNTVLFGVQLRLP